MLIPLLLALTAQPAATPDPIEGKWLGTVGFPQDRVQIGLDIHPNDKGELQAKITQPVLNVYNMDLPGPITRDPGSGAADTASYTASGFGLTVMLKDGKLEGTLSGAKVPITLERTDSLPAEAPIPDLPAGPGPKWKLALGAPIYAPVEIRDHIAYVGTTGGVFQAISIGEGKLAWTFSAGRPIHGQALATESSVFFTADNGHVYRLARDSGREMWRYDLGDAQIPRILPHPGVYEYDYRAPRPVLIGSTIFIGAADGGFHAIDAASGTQRWRIQTRGRIRADAVPSGNHVLAASWDGTLYALDQETGAFAWTYDTKGTITTAPTVHDNRIIVGNRGSVLRSLNPIDGTSQWRQLFWGSWVESVAVSPAPSDGRLYIGSSDLRRVTCFDPADGRVIWRTDVYGCPWGTPAITQKRLYTGAVGSAGYMIRHEPGLLALDRGTGAIVWRWVPPANDSALQTGFAAGPAIDHSNPDGSTLVIGGIEGSLYAFPCE